MNQHQQDDYDNNGMGFMSASSAGDGELVGGSDYYANTCSGNSGRYNDNPNNNQQHYQDGYANDNYDDRARHHHSAADYYPEHHHQYEDQHRHHQFEEYSADIHYNTNNPNSLFHSLHHRMPFVVHPYVQPDNYGTFDTQGDPISAIAVVDDDNDRGSRTANNEEEDGVPTLMYVASHTSYQGEQRSGGIHIPRCSNDGVSTLKQDPSLSRGSRMTILYDDAAAKGNGGYYGDRSIYSTFVAHPQAPLKRLDTLHSVLFGNGQNTHHFSNNTLISVPKARPSHAYGPPFGPPSIVAQYCNHHHRSSTATAIFGDDYNLNLNYNLDRPEERHCMGITSIMPVTTPYLGSGGRVCSVSPRGVRIHTRGGMVMSSKEDLLSGMTCGVLMGGGRGSISSQFATVGGMSFPSKDNTSSSNSSSGIRRTQHVHCVDLSRDLKIVSSHTLVRNRATGSNGEEGSHMMCVADMALNHQRNNIVVGCSDGTLRVLDGQGRRNAEVAKAKAQPGGVAKVAVSENLICTTGYTSPGHSSPNSPFPYPFPSPHVLIYDLRYLGRGGIPHMFSTTFHHRGGPRFVNFLPDGRLLMGSGLTFGSIEVITPFFDTNGESSCGGANDNDNDFFQPELNVGEAMTTVNVYGEDALYIGTSYGRVLQYRLTDCTNTVHLAKNIRGFPKRSLSVKSVPGARASGVGSATPPMVAAEEPLDMPPFLPVLPAASIDPAILLSSSTNNPSASEAGMRGWNIFGGYVLSSPPLLSSNDRALLHQRYSRLAARGAILGSLGSRALVSPSKRWLSKRLQKKLDETTTILSIVNSSGTGDNPGADFVKVFPTTSLELNGLLMTPDVSAIEESSPSDYRGKKKGIHKNKHEATTTKKTFPNPNTFLYSKASFAACYDATADPRKRIQDNRRPVGQQHSGEDEPINEEQGIPLRYRLMTRPPFYKVSNFDYTAYNDTGVWVGWDYAPSFANSFACSVLALLYFVGEIRELALQLQLGECWEMSFNKTQLQQQQGGNVGGHETSVSVTAQLGLLFHLIETLSANGMIQPSLGNNKTTDDRGQVKAFVPSNFISAFALLPEAVNLALVDGVAGSAEIARRPEAFYRFLMQYIERELGQLSSSISTEQASTSTSTSNQGGQLIDCMQGVSFLSIIEYPRGKPKISTSRAFTVDLAYDQKLSTSCNTASPNSVVRFGEILRFSLCKEVPLRAWCEDARSYELAVQRRIAKSLPSLLSLSCCCAGTKADTHGLQFWQQENSRNWLPEFIKIQIEIDKSITVEELVVDEEGKEKWMTFEQKLPESSPFFEAWKEELPQNFPVKKSYQLNAVVSFIRTNPDASADHDASHSCEGHHVVHVRTPKDLESAALTKQLHQIERCLAEKEGHNPATNKGYSSTVTATNQQLTLVSEISFAERQQQVQEKLRKLREKEESSDQWVLLNGFVVTKVDKSDDVRSFNAKFKEPSIVIFREISDPDNSGETVVNVESKKEQLVALPRALQKKTMVPVSVMGTTSLSNGRGPTHAISEFLELPTNGDLVAIDTEFVCVQPEEALITSSGSKEIISEPRNALARLSVMNCQTNEVIIDDYILPRESVVDYLTRFSGIRQNDLDSNSSPHHLVTPNEAYLKVRLLMERGCIFVGHGLSQDFRIINICIPPNQIIDTAEIFHQPDQRYISLRYLTNYVMGRDMQQEVHDSIEDARAAHELYMKALSLKKEGRLDDYLMQLYAHGHRTQFKLGVVNNK